MPRFSPPLDTKALSEELPFVRLKKLESTANDDSRPFIMLFIGGVKLPPNQTAQKHPLAKEVNDNFYDNDPSLVPACTFTQMVAMAYASAGFNVILHKIDYDDKPAWYTTIADQPRWNNKGQFPGAYIKGNTWMTDSEDLMKLLVSDYPSHHSIINLTPSSLDESVYSANVFFKLLPYIQNKDPNSKSETNEKIFKPLNAHLKENKFICGDHIGEVDVRFSMFAMAANYLAVYFDGVSFVDDEYTHIYSYFNRIYNSKPFIIAASGIQIPPPLVVAKVTSNFKKFGMKVKEAAMLNNINDIDITANYAYFDARETLKVSLTLDSAAPLRTTAKAATSSSSPPIVSTKPDGSHLLRASVRRVTAAKIFGSSSDASASPARNRPKIDRDALKSKTKRSKNLDLRKNWYWLLLDSGYKKLMLVVILAYASVSFLMALITLPFEDQITGGEDLDETIHGFHKVFLYTLTNVISMGLGTFEPTRPESQYLAVFSLLIGTVINVILFSIIVTKFQRPQAEIVFSKNAILTARNGVPHLSFRVGNLRGNLLYKPSIMITSMSPIQTEEGENLMYMEELETISKPATMSGSFTVAHEITQESPLSEILNEEGLDDFEGTLAIVFEATDATYHSQVLSTKKYYGRDLRFGYRFSDILEVKDGFSSVNWRHFDKLVEINVTKAYKSNRFQRQGPQSRGRVRGVSSPSKGYSHLSQFEHTSREICAVPEGFEPPDFPPNTLFLFPTALSKNGCTLPTCTYTRSLFALARLCGMKVYMLGVMVGDAPDWMSKVSWNTTVDDTDTAAKTPVTNSLNSIKCHIDGSNYSGFSTLNQLIKSKSKDKFDAIDSNALDSKIAGESIFDFYSDVQGRIGSFLQSGSVDEQKTTNDNLLSVAETLDEVCSSGKKYLTADHPMLADALIFPLIDRIYTLLSHFERPLDNKKFKHLWEYKITCEGSSIFPVFEKSDLAYMDSLRMLFGGELRSKQSRITATVCI